MRKRTLPVLAAVVLTLAAAAYTAVFPSSLTESRIVTRVIDGDTIVVEGGDRVRLLGMDTPERGQKCYSEAKQRLAELIDNKEVVLEAKGEDKDLYGRLLRYVFVNDTFVNLLLVREGLANLYVVNRDSYYPMLIEAEQLAKEENLCVWQA